MKPAQTAVLILGATPSVGLQVVHSLAWTRRYRLTTASAEHPHLLSRSRHCRHVHLAGWSWRAGPEQLDAHFAGWTGAVLLPVETSAVRWMIRHAEALRQRWRLVPLPPADSFEQAFHKATVSELAQGLGLEIPHLHRLAVGPGANLADLPPEIAFPALLKPAHGTGGEGIVRLPDRASLEARLPKLRPESEYFVQNYIPGTDLSCGFLCQDGVVRAAVTYLCLARRTEYGAFRSLQVVRDAEAEAVGARLLSAMQWNGVANLDLRRAHDGRLYLLDFNPRCWGNLRSLLGTGLNFADLLCLAALGQPIPSHVPRCLAYLSPLDTVAAILRRMRHPLTHDPVQWSWRASSLRFVANDPAVYWSLLREQVGVAGGWWKHLAWLRRYARQGRSRGHETPLQASPRRSSS
jgi:hypothetical protein